MMENGVEEKNVCGRSLSGIGDNRKSSAGVPHHGDSSGSQCSSMKASISSEMSPR